MNKNRFTFLVTTAANGQDRINCAWQQSNPTNAAGDCPLLAGKQVVGKGRRSTFSKPA